MTEWQASIVADDRKKKIRSGYDKHLVADAAEVAKWPHVSDRCARSPRRNKRRVPLGQPMGVSPRHLDRRSAGPQETIRA